MKKLNMTTNRNIPLIAIIILFQVIAMLVVANQKEEYHIDEIYSYIISNSYDSDRISNDDSLWGNWTDGEQLNDFVSVQNGEAFAYQKAYKNTSTDCHPPMYYWALHTVSSFFPNQFNKWMGIGLNIFFFIISIGMLYLCSVELIKNRWLQFLPTIMYGFSSFAVGTCLFIRMYMLLTMLALIFTYASIRLVKYGFHIKWCIISWAVLYLGAMTQYYFIILGFWGVLFVCIHFLHRKQIKNAFIYGFGALASIGLMLLSFPYAIEQATGSGTNNVGNEVVRNLFNVKLWIIMTYSLIKQAVANISYHYLVSYLIIVSVLLIFAALFVVKKLKKNNRITVDTSVLWCLSCLILTMLSVSFIGGEYVYLRYVYFVIPLAYIVAIYLFSVLSEDVILIQKLLAVVCIGFALMNISLGIIKKMDSSLYLGQSEQTETVCTYKDTPLVISMRKRSTAIPTGNLTKIKNFDRIYMDTVENLKNGSVIPSCLSENGDCLIYIPTDTYWVEGYVPEELLTELLPNSEYYCTYIANGTLGKFYYISTK